MVKANVEYQEIEILEDEKNYDLLQLRRAIAEERYEVCSFWAKMARKNGATRSEISFQITRFLAGETLLLPKGGL